MKQPITNYVKSSDQCWKYNVTRLQIPSSLNGNRNVLVLTDRLADYVLAQASRNNIAQDTPRIIMEEVILVRGPPDTIITD
ncbi:unnamed protein product [Rotaria sp. Silwood1]|nr:unnamed protein product [Rotaria sp. Silwood1]